MTPTEAGLLAAVLENPADDGVRLVYADWLDEHGGQPERAEFIRVQCRLAVLDHELMSNEDCEHSDCPGCAERRHLLGREQAILFATSAQRHPTLGERHNLFFWAIDLIEAVPQGATYTDHLRFRRGFVEGIACTAEFWLAHADNVLSVHPIREVTLTPDAIIDGDSIGLSDRNTLTIDPMLGQKLLKLEWPGITFRLPAVQPAFPRWVGTTAA